MLTALILICAVTVAAEFAQCTRQNARTVTRVPGEFGSPTTCFLHAQAYLAETSFGQELDPNDRIKIICVRNGASEAF
jgi:hypothetical protein